MIQVVPDIESSAQTLWQVESRAGMGFTTLTGFVTIAGTTETDFMLMRNPSGSGVLCRFYEFIMTINSATAQRSIFRFYRSPTVSADGTPLTISKVLATGTPTTKLLAFQTPTISDRGSLIQMFSIENVTYPRMQDLGRYLVQNAELLITVQGTTTNIEHNILGVWAEEPI